MLPPDHPDEASGTRALNAFMEGLYAADMFLEGRQRDVVLRSGIHFLQATARLSVLSAERREDKFPVTPKHHALYHLVKLCEWQSDISGGWAINMVLESTAQDEDFIGRIAKVARSVDPRSTCVRTLQRYLLMCRQIWHST